MKRILVLFIFTIAATMSEAQQKDNIYKKQWQEIDTLIIKKGLPKSALSKVNILYADAKSKGYKDEMIKALLYRISLENEVNEEDPNVQDKLLKAEIKAANDVVQKSILYVLLAYNYETYFQQHSWELRERSKTINQKKDDITTWSADDFNSEIAALYEKALQPVTALQSTKLEAYNAIIIKGNAGNLRPTLYDLLAHRALDHFKNDNNYLTQPEYAFEIKEAAALSTADVFIQHQFETVDTSSNMLQALKLFQQLMKFHKNDKDASALIDVNIERIVWVNEKEIVEDKNSLYKSALEEVTTKYADNKVAAQAWYLQAKIYADNAATYEPFGDTTHRFDYLAAKKIIDERLKKDSAKSEGRSNMLQLLNEITSVELKSQVEEVNVPGQAFRMLVNYRNTEKMYVRIINAAQLETITVERWNEKYWNALTKLSYQKSYAQALPATKDYQEHSAEVKVDALVHGGYAILASSGKEFDSKKDKMILQRFDVSNISYIKNGDDYFVLHRETGASLPNTTVRYGLETYSSKLSKYIDGKLTKLKVDSNGMFRLPVPTNTDYGRRTILHFTYGEDTLKSRVNDYYRTYVNTGSADTSNYEQKNTEIFFFTDRSIYRPGQKVFFKGIAVVRDKETKRYKIVSAQKNMNIQLNDANDQLVDSLDVKTNEYGSFTGTFIIPQSTLTGEFSIAAEPYDGYASINVEEYKRPKFYVAFDTLKAEYKLNDTITITGYSKSYAGNAMDNATVKFNIQRNTRFLYPWMFWRTSWPRGEQQQIKDGIIKTDAVGKFEISFVAKPDNKVDKSGDPVFDFAVEASVTDNSGETRDGNTRVSVGYKSLQLSLDVPAVAEINAFKEINVSAKNLSGKEVTADVSISISPLVTPSKVYRERMWQQPDQYSMSKAEFESAFPYDVFEKENDHRAWFKKDAVLNGAVNTNDSTAFNISRAKLAEGWYVVEATAKDKEGNDVKDVQYIQLYKSNTEVLPSKQANWEAVVQNTVQPGEEAKLLIGSSYENVHLILNTNRKKDSEIDSNYYEFHLLNAKKEIYNTTAKEADRAGLGMWYAFVKHNRFYSGGTSVQMPNLHKDLQIDYTTYRNKTEPGSEEKWTITVKGDDKEKVSAELLTAMYDASLDQFKPHRWSVPAIWSNGYSSNKWQGRNGFSISQGEENYLLSNGLIKTRYFKQDELFVKASSFDLDNRRMQFSSVASFNGEVTVLAARQAPQLLKLSGAFEGLYKAESMSDTVKFNMKSSGKQTTENNETPSIQPRKNFNETAFFIPQLTADAAGNYSFSFTMPEALTEWKWLSIAHTKQLAFGINEVKIVTQKTLMVQPNLPRFLREGDKLELTARISNLSDSALTGTAALQLFDAVTNQPVDGLFQSVFPDQYFTAEAKQSTTVKFPVTIPFNYSKPLTIKIIAKAGAYGDGEENTIPVLTNRMLVTETLPLYMRGEGSKEFTFEKLLNNNSPTLTNESLTIEYTPQPIWYAVQALPYVMEYPYECAEQTFNRFYANALAAFIISKHPGIKEVFEKWKSDTTALVSNLEKNQELKQVLLKETPWVLDATNETQQRKNIALLFDVANMSSSITKALQQLKQMQLGSGGFPWFKGGYEDRYITQYILIGIGKLKKIGALNQTTVDLLDGIEQSALNYVDAKMQEDIRRVKKEDLNKDQLGSTEIQYLYMRSFFSDYKFDKHTTELYKYYLQQAKQYWNKKDNYFKAMIAVALYRNNEQSFADKNIIPSIIENATVDVEKGMYWKDNKWGYYWYQSPIEQQALMIEMMNDMLQQKPNEKINEHINGMQTWLLLNKQTNNWKTTKATADACYALLLNPNSLSDQPLAVSINLGDYSINSVEKQQQSGTGYIKEKIKAADVKPAMGNIYVGVSNPVGKNATSPASWGAVYWQYFEDLDKITAAQTPLSLSKKMFIEKNTAKGKVLQPVVDNEELHVGDKVIMQVTLKSDRDMEYLHLKDMRAASMEPTNVLSTYKWQDGLGYYESTKDASTDFFISYLPKGTYVFEYPAYITHTGNFSVGVANIQCMYAPEFSAHSEGIRINVENAE